MVKGERCLLASLRVLTPTEQRQELSELSSVQERRRRRRADDSIPLPSVYQRVLCDWA